MPRPVSVRWMRYRGGGSVLGMMVPHERPRTWDADRKGPIIEIRCVPGRAATAAWGTRVAVLADLGAADSLAIELAELLASPDAGTAEVIGLLVPGGGRQVDDFAVAEELADGRLRVVLRGRSACSIGGTGPRSGGVWRSRVVAAADVELYGPGGPASAGAPDGEWSAVPDGEPAVSPVFASSVRLRVAGSSDPGAPRRALPASDRSDRAATTRRPGTAE